jgi:hypothetical protein
MVREVGDGVAIPHHQKKTNRRGRSALSVIASPLLFKLFILMRWHPSVDTHHTSPLPPFVTPHDSIHRACKTYLDVGMDGHALCLGCRLNFFDLL